MSVEKELKVMSEAMKADMDFAWSWHCNIAMASVDEGMDHAAANRAAARFMKLAFGVDTTKCEHYADTQYHLVDLDKIMWESIQKAAGESKWMPEEYTANDWVADVQDFLRNGPKSTDG